MTTAPTVTRTGRVMYLAGYEQNRYQLGSSPVYREARVEERSDGSLIYYPPTAMAQTSDGGVTLPANLVDSVVWS